MTLVIWKETNLYFQDKADQSSKAIEDNITEMQNKEDMAEYKDCGDPQYLHPWQKRCLVTNPIKLAHVQG